jgi:mono/diheme cytochrome c family protein
MRRWHVVAVCALLAGCTRSNMDSQPKYHEYEPGALRAPVAGTAARDDLARADETKQKPAVTGQLLARGHEQYDIYCSPCHDRVGTSNGIVVQRGMAKPPSLHDTRLRTADDQHVFDVISNGYGVMYAHGDRIRPRNRWAIVAYIRALQLSQHAALADLPAEDQSRVETAP